MQMYRPLALRGIRPAFKNHEKWFQDTRPDYLLKLPPECVDRAEAVVVEYEASRTIRFALDKEDRFFAVYVENAMPLRRLWSRRWTRPCPISE